jgi:hypothetical protein
MYVSSGSNIPAFRRHVTIFISCLQCPDRPWSTPSFLYNGNRGISPRGKADGEWSAEVKNAWGAPPIPHPYSWRRSWLNTGTYSPYGSSYKSWNTHMDKILRVKYVGLTATNKYQQQWCTQIRETLRWSRHVTELHPGWLILTDILRRPTFYSTLMKTASQATDSSRPPDRMKYSDDYYFLVYWMWRC